jgi:hypothetical protein
VSFVLDNTRILILVILTSYFILILLLAVVPRDTLYRLDWIRLANFKLINIVSIVFIFFLSIVEADYDLL